jgi:kumamolisin
MKKAILASVIVVLLSTSIMQPSSFASQARSPEFYIPVNSDALSVPQGSASVHRLGNATLHILVSLRLNHEEALARLISEQSNPASYNYQRFLSPAQFESRFSPTESQVRSVTGYLQSHGIHVLHVASDRLLIDAAASPSAVDSAFGITMVSFTLQGKTYYTATGTVTVPFQIAVLVNGIEGLQNFDIATHPALYVNNSAVPSYSPPTGPDASPPYNPATIHEAYNFTGIYKDGYSGTGTSVSIVTAYAFSNSTLANFESTFAISPKRINVIQPYGQTSQLDLETTLDTEWMSSTAPNATINVVEGPNPQLSTFTELFNYVVEHNLSSVMTTSWGTPESQTPASTMSSDNQTFMQAAAEGITTFAASGDFGAYDNTSSPTVDFPASSPFVTGVGGTWLNLTQSGSNVAVSSETGWNRSGGGVSTVFARPSWQTGYGNFVSGGGREVPDVSLNAKPSSGYFVYYNNTWDEAGGTSFGAPIWGGIISLENQLRLAKGEGPIGFLNPAIYRILNSANYTVAFNDITVGYNGYYAAGPGYDMVTGIGTPSVYNLLLVLARQPTQPLAAHATGSPSWGDIPLSVSLYANISGGLRPYSIDWAVNTSSGGWKTFNSSAATLAEILHAGNYSFRLTVRDNASETAVSFFNVTAYSAPADSMSAGLSGSPSNGDAPLAVSFTASVSSVPFGAVVTSYDYAFGDGAYLLNSSSTAVKHVYAAGGQISALVTVYAMYAGAPNGGYTAQSVFNLVVYPHLTASINSSRLGGSYPLRITFSAAVTGGRQPYAASWQYANQSGVYRSSGISLNVTYTSVGNYSLTLTVKDYYGSSSNASENIRIFPPLNGVITVLPSNNGVAPYNATFNASVSGGSGIYFYAWHFGGGATSHGNPVSHVFVSGGTYRVKLTVNDTAGDTVNITTQLTIQGLGLIPLLENPTTLIILFLTVIVAATAGYFIFRKK